MSPRPHTVVTFAVDAPSSAIVEPPTHIREEGFATGTRPPAQWINYLFRDLGLWVNRLRGPSRSRWTRTAYPGNSMIAAAVDTITVDSGLANPIRRLVALNDSGLNALYASVRGDTWVALTMEPTASIGGPLCICAADVGWFVGGFLPASVDGGIWSTPYDPDGSSAIRDPVNTWTAHTLPASTTIVKAIACRLTGVSASAAIACTDTKILYRSAPTTWANASIGGTISGTVLDVCDTQSAWLAVTSNGQVLRTTSPSATWTLATTLPAADWRLASNGLGTVVAYRYNTAGGADWYVSTDHGLSWGVLAPPFAIDFVRRVRFVDGTWFCASSDYPFLSESNDLASWNRIAVPHVIGASHQLDDVVLVDEGIVAVGDEHWLLGARGELVAQGPWSPAGSSLAIADAGYLQGRAVAPTAPTNGQVLAWSTTNSRYEPTTISGGGGGGTYASLTDVDVTGVANGHLPWYDAGGSKWKTLAPGSARTPLVSQGPAATPAYAIDVVPLTQRIEDGVTSGVSVCATIAHDTTGGPGADGIGARCLLRARNGSGAIADAASIDGVLTTAAGGAEVGALDVRARASGSLSRVARFTAAEIELDTIVSFAKAVRSVAQVVSGTSHTLALTDAGNLRCTNTAARAINLPALGTVTNAHIGLEWRIHDAARTADSANITITAPSGVTLNGTSGGSAVLDTKGGAVIVRVVAGNEWETVGL